MTEQEYNYWVNLLDSYKNNLQELELTDQPDLIRDQIIFINIQIGWVENKLAEYDN